MYYTRQCLCKINIHCQDSCINALIHKTDSSNFIHVYRKFSIYSATFALMHAIQLNVNAACRTKLEHPGAEMSTSMYIFHTRVKTGIRWSFGMTYIRIIFYYSLALLPGLFIRCLLFLTNFTRVIDLTMQVLKC